MVTDSFYPGGPGVSKRKGQVTINALAAEYDEKHGYWILKWGRETFYDEQRQLRTWPTAEAALCWAMNNLPAFMARTYEQK